MTTDEEISQILSEHTGQKVGAITIRPLSMEDLFEVAADMKLIAKPIIEGISKLDQTIDDTQMLVDALLELLTPALPAVRRTMARCIDRPLREVPMPLAPLLLRRFLEQNFSGPRLKPWVDLFRQIAAEARINNNPPGTSGTPASSLPTTDTTGGPIPPTSSNSGAGDASGAKPVPPPTN